MTRQVDRADQIELRRERFRVIVTDDGSIRLDMIGWSQNLTPIVSADTLGAFDRHRTTRVAGLQQHDGFERITWTERSTLWAKQHHLDVHDDHLVFRSRLYGRGAVDTIRFFDAIEDSGFVEHFALTKHFNDRGQTTSTEYSVGSPIGFRHVLCPEPNSHAQQLIKPFEYAQVSAHADLDHRGGNFVANPGLLAFAMARELDGEWLVMGLAVEPGEHHFSEFDYVGGETFGLRLNCWGVPPVDGMFCPPSVVLVTGPTAEDALLRYVTVLKDSGLVPRPTRHEASWWQRPIVCGWGHQCYQADLFRVRSSAERLPDNAAYTLCTQLNYRDIVDTLNHHGVPWGTLVIDARWFLSGGLKNVDTGRWPDLPMPSLAAWREYTREQRAIGVPSLYYLTHLDTTGEALDAADYALIRASWRGL